MEEQEIMEQEQETTTTTQQEQETTTTTFTTTMNGQTVILNLNSENEAGEPLPNNSENIIHQLFKELGCDLDYTPTTNHQQFTMFLQFAAALWFIYWFVKMLWGLMRDFFKW